MRVEIWSDVICPWCYLGKRRFEAALGRFGHPGEVEVVWRSFQLDPEAPRVSSETMNQVLARKYRMPAVQAAALNARMESLAAEAGLEYHLGSARYANTFDAHRLLHLAHRHDLQPAMQERLMRAYFTENLPLGDSETLVRLGSEVGLDPAESRAVVQSNDYADEVHHDVQRAMSLGIRGVPFFVVDETYGVSGAQSSKVLLEILERAWAESHTPETVGTQGGADTIDAGEADACAVAPAGDGVA